MLDKTIKDPYFGLKVISCTPNPQKLVLWAAHQDYSEDWLVEELDNDNSFLHMSESEAGEKAVNKLLRGNKGHYGPYEHPQIIVSAGYFPHSTMQQVRTHRNVSYDVQSFRYTGRKIAKLGERIVQEKLSFLSVLDDLERLFYFRPIGTYKDRSGRGYTVTEDWRKERILAAYHAVSDYYHNVYRGMSYEDARGSIPFDVRQHWVFSGNARAVMHLLDLRGKLDAQRECVTYAEFLFDAFASWMPETASYYEKKRLRKAVLAP